MHESTFWGQELNHIVKGDKEIPLWTNPTVGAGVGEKVRFHVIGIGTAFIPFTCTLTAGSKPVRPA